METVLKNNKLYNIESVKDIFSFCDIITSKKMKEFELTDVDTLWSMYEYVWLLKDSEHVLPHTYYSYHEFDEECKWIVDDIQCINFIKPVNYTLGREIEALKKLKDLVSKKTKMDETSCIKDEIYIAFDEYLLIKYERLFSEIFLTEDSMGYQEVVIINS